MANNYLDTTLLDKAIVFAVKAHHDTERRGKGFPYIVHPMEAVSIVATMTSDPELLAAAVLHDVVEDTDVDIDRIRRSFGARIAALVDTESDRFPVGESEEESWHARKKASLERLRNASRDAKIVALGDKLSNMRAIARDEKELGAAFWNRFHIKEKSAHAQRYRELVDALKELSDSFAYQEFKHLVEVVFGDEK